ncbi:hypothetical protein [Pseudomonas sp. DP-17]|uniref:hypothetical protein n=1 Tax=Pseudomonas sp. DP-17 TaxID=1580486 RepID=UPI001EFA8E87|nr:hypothetical protein [Pseudomonas sp. DP-17]MCG8911058.1 hypothetical protein [Pseudomonas sp. DP-17]
MQRYLRLCLLLLFSFALPFNGMAGEQSPSEPCPMKSASMSKVMDMGVDCCHGNSDHGKLCKPGLECKTVSILQVRFLKPVLDLAFPVATTSLSDFLPERIPSSIWHPPRI